MCISYMKILYHSHKGPKCLWILVSMGGGGRIPGTNPLGIPRFNASSEWKFGEQGEEKLGVRWEAGSS